MKALVACEESQVVTIELRKLGVEAYSCDIQECSGGHPEWHLCQDVLPLLYEDWDLIIAHPPCTYLTAAGAVRLFNKNHSIKDEHRLEQGKEAADFFMKCLDAPCKHIAVENPTPMRIYNLPEYSQAIQPYEHGDHWRKRTCLWLQGLPLLVPTKIVQPIGYWVGAHGHNKAKYGMSMGFRDPKIRSKTFPGIAHAMATQWVTYIRETEGIV